MLFDLAAGIVALSLGLPIAVIGFSWVRTRAFFARTEVAHRQRTMYYAALIAASITSIAYLCFWVWRVLGIYSVDVPFAYRLWLERCMYLSGVSSLASLVSLIFGIGPNRSLIALSVVIMTSYLYCRLPLIHWA